MDDIQKLKREYCIMKQRYKRLEEKYRDISFDKIELLNKIKELKIELSSAKKSR